MTGETKNLGQLLREHRKAAGLTQEELAERAEISIRALSDLERGRHTRPHRDTVELLASALSLPAGESARLQAAIDRTRTKRGPAASTRPGMVPADVTPLIGRERDEAAAVALLGRDEVRLVTLAGPGGVGKTRLAYRVARTVRDSYEHDVRLVSLAPIRDARFVLRGIAASLGLRETSRDDLFGVVGDAIGNQELLLVVDNFEHVLDAAPVLAHLLSSCPNLNILATSREALRLQGEHVFDVLPLALPPLGVDVAALEALEQFPASAVFLDRARACGLPAPLTDTDSAAIVEICRRVDGLPLALELAAGQLRYQRPAQLRDALGRDLGALSGGPRDAPNRQATMRAAIAWTDGLLTSEDAEAFHRLSIFSGGFVAEAAAAILMTGVEAADAVIRRFVDKSLVLADRGRPAARFRMLEVILEFAAEELERAGLAEQTRERHARYFLRLAEEAGPRVTGADSERWLNTLDDELANIRAALQWLLDRRRAEEGLRMGAALFRYWHHSGRLVEGRSSLERFLALPTQPQGTRARALDGAGTLAYFMADYPAAKAFWEECRQLALSVGEQIALGGALNGLGLVEGDTGRHEAAKGLLEESVCVRRQAGDVWGMAGSLNNLASVHQRMGEIVAAERLYQESLTAYRSLGPSIPAIPTTLNNLGMTAQHRGNADAAGAYYREALREAERLRRAQPAIQAMNHLGNLANSEERFAEAEDWYIKSLELAREAGFQSHEALALANLGIVARLTGRLRRAREMATASIDLNRRLGNQRNLAYALQDLADVERDEGRIERARRGYRENLTINLGIGFRNGVAECVDHWAETEARIGDAELAVTLSSAVEVLRSEIDAGMTEKSREKREQRFAELRAQLGDASFERAWEHGRRLNVAELITG